MTSPENQAHQWPLTCWSSELAPVNTPLGFTKKENAADMEPLSPGKFNIDVPPFTLIQKSAQNRKSTGVGDTPGECNNCFNNISLLGSFSLSCLLLQ